MLVGQMPIGVGHIFGQKQSVFRTNCVAQLLETLRPQQLAKRVRCINGSINDDVGNVNALWCKLGIQGLTEHATTAHGRGVRMLARIAPHGGS